MRHDIDPFPIPAQDAAPHFIGLVRCNLLLETTVNGSQHDAPMALGRNAIGADYNAGCVVKFLYAFAQEAADNIGASHVKITEVGAIGFVEIIVAF